MQLSNPISADILTNMFRTSPKDHLRIINREGSRIEFKESYSHGGMAQYFKTIASFANNVGGYIFFGVGDSPRRLLGLRDKNLQQFEHLKVEEFTKNLCDYFSPEIKWDHCTFEFKGMSFGVIYTYPLAADRKPCICTKAYSDKNPKYCLKEGDIYYRYGGRSERIHYNELNAIIEASRKNEESRWLDFIKRAAKVGIENACLFDLGNGLVSGEGGSLIIDENLLSKIAFIKEGEFVERKGKPALRLIGDIQDIEPGKIVVKESTKKVVKAIEPGDVVRAFLRDDKVDEPIEYLRSICFANTPNNPFYFLLQQAQLSTNDAINIIASVFSRKSIKKKLIERIEGNIIPQTKLSITDSDVSKKKRAFREEWLSQRLNIKEDELRYILTALMSLTKKDVISRERYIRNKLLEIYDTYFEKVKSTDATNLRKAICRIDELLYRDKCMNEETV